MLVILIIEQMNKNKVTLPVNPFIGQRSLNLPSNLLHGRCTALNSDRKTFQQKMMQTFNTVPEGRYKTSRKHPKFIEQKSTHKKEVLYKRLTNIRVDNQELIGLSFSKLLSKMVVLDEEKDANIDTLDDLYKVERRKKPLPNLKCIRQKEYRLDCQTEKTQKHDYTKHVSHSVDVNEIESSKKIFKKFYNPNAQLRNLNPSNAQQNYIYRNGKTVQCKRIHNFYTSHMYRKGYDKFFRNTINGSFYPPN